MIRAFDAIFLTLVALTALTTSSWARPRLFQCINSRVDHRLSGFTSRREAFRAAKWDARIPMNQQPFETRHVPMVDPFGHVIKDAHGKVILTREYFYRTEAGKVVVIQEHSAGHKFFDGNAGEQGPHVQVRPIEDLRHGQIPGTMDHYGYRKD